jgi:hypothetical protein
MSEPIPDDGPIKGVWFLPFAGKPATPEQQAAMRHLKVYEKAEWEPGLLNKPDEPGQS